MTRPTTELLSSAFLATLLCIAGACERPAEAPKAAAELEAPATESTAKAPALATSQTPTPRAESPARTLAPAPALDIEDAPVLASAATTPVPAAKTLAPKSRATDSLRHPSLLPPNTPEAHVAAFTRLPLGKRDKAPIAGVGASGIHLDELELGAGWAASRCEDPSTSFRVGADTRVNLCFRVVHPRTAESVSVEWARDGKVRQIINVGVRDTHAHLTRAWLPVTEGRAGEWTATIKSEDGSILGQTHFTIAS